LPPKLAKKGMQVGIFNKISSIWTNRKALAKAARARALAVGDSTLAVIANSVQVADTLLESMLRLESIYGGALSGSEKAQKVIAIMRVIDPQLDRVEDYLRSAITRIHDELNKDQKAGWGA
jgi:hypothetical protein